MWRGSCLGLSPGIKSWGDPNHSQSFHGSRGQVKPIENMTLEWESMESDDSSKHHYPSINMFFITKIVAVVFFGECNLYYVYVYSFDASLFFGGEQHRDLKNTPRPPLPQGCVAAHRHWQLAWSSTTVDGKFAIAAQGWQLAFRSQVIIDAETHWDWEKICREDGWMTRIWSKWYWRVSAEFAKFRM